MMNTSSHNCIKSRPLDTVTCGIEAKQERAGNSKCQQPNHCNHNGHPPAGAGSCAVLIMNRHNHCSVSAKGTNSKARVMKMEELLQGMYGKGGGNRENKREMNGKIYIK